MAALARTKKKETDVEESSGDESLTDGLKLQPKAVETAPSRPPHASPSDLSRAGNSASTMRGPQPPSRPLPDHLHTTTPRTPLHPENSPTPAVPSVPSTPDPASPRPAPPAQQGAPCGEVDPLFIRTVTAAELVCGERKYKCSGCLRYYDHLGTLLGHVDQGWREGFSCHVFYRKLRSMRESRLVLCSTGSDADRELGVSSSTGPGSAHLAPADKRRSHTSSTGGKKADMIHKWLQKK